MKTAINYNLILSHLKRHNLEFCFLKSNGMMVTRETCENEIAKSNISIMAKAFLNTK